MAKTTVVKTNKITTGGAVGTGVKKFHDDYLIYSDKWLRCRDVCAGQDAIYAGSFRYLPPLRDEVVAGDRTTYDARLKRTPFYNASWRTVAGFVGMLFRKPAVLKAPEQLKKLLEDVTLTGISFDDFAKDIAFENLEVSRVGIFIDHPAQRVNDDGTPVTQAQAQAEDLRPVMLKYTTEAIRNWQYGRIGNRTVLTQVRLSETRTIVVNEFESKSEAIIRVLDMYEGKYRVRFFIEESETQIGTEYFPIREGKPLDHIPFYIIGPDGNSNEVTDPILIDLFDLNIKHFQVSASYEHGCHFTALPTLVITGHGDTELGADGKPVKRDYYIGSTTAWVIPEPDAHVTYAEFTGAGLKALKENLDAKEGQMAAMGARMLAPEKAGVEAAETLAIRSSGENSVLSAVAISTSTGLEKALTEFALWASIKAKIEYNINREFVPATIDSNMLKALMSLVQAGQMSGETFYMLRQRSDLGDPELTYADEQARIDANPVPMPTTLDPTGGKLFGQKPVDPNAPKPKSEPKSKTKE